VSVTGLVEKNPPPHDAEAGPSAAELRPALSDGWRQERFGPRGADGKGRYWQWRRGVGKDRESLYGGKVSGE